jgi:mycothiol synthase
VSYHVRNYRPSDFEEYAALHIESARLHLTGLSSSSQLLREDMGFPGHVPESDLFLAELEDGRIAGCADVRPETGIGRAVIRVLVHPGYWHSRLGGALLWRAEERASRVGARVAHVNVPEESEEMKELLAEQGFVPVRRFLELGLKMACLRRGARPGSLACRELGHGEEEKLARLQNRCFAATWGYNPNTVEQIMYRLSMSDCWYGGVVLLWEGSEPIAYCWTTIDARRGRIYMIGVDRRRQGKGLGRGVLAAGLEFLKSRDVQAVELTVDSENREALRLYEKVGFRACAASLWYEKPVGRPAEGGTR